MSFDLFKIASHILDQCHVNNQWDPSVFMDISSFERVFILGIGKCAPSHVDSVVRILRERAISPERGLIITKEGMARQYDHSFSFESSHPVCSYKSVEAAEKVTEYISQVGKRDLLIFLLSGGTSALIAQPHSFFSLEEKRELSRQLLLGGASIEEINLLRSEVSRIKNGGLLADFGGDQVLCLLTSDIPSDSWEWVGSSPFIYTPSEVSRLYELARVHIKEPLLSKLKHYFESKERRRQIQIRTSSRARVDCKVISNWRTLLFESERCFESIGKSVLKIDKVLDLQINAGIQVFIDVLEQNFRELSDWVLLGVGELRTKVQGTGKGGRASEFVLRLAYELFYVNSLRLSRPNLSKIKVFAIASDGDDGNSGGAGGALDYDAFCRVSITRIEKALVENDSYSILKLLGTHIELSPTNVNLMDLYGVSVEK